MFPPLSGTSSHFNSRPHGGRPSWKPDESIDVSFQLTPSRRATETPFRWLPLSAISTHALTEGDQSFQFIVGFRNISTHALTEGDLISRVATAIEGISTHALTEGDSDAAASSNEYTDISTHALTEGDELRPGASFEIELISTHALTEGDGKFRQIFLLNRGYAYSISLYFLPHFISLLPQILSFQQKSFKFQVRIFLLFSVHLAFALQNQCVHHVKSRFCTNMFYFVFVLFTQIVKPQTIGLFIYDFF